MNPPLPRRKRAEAFGLIEVIVGLAVAAVLAVVTPLIGSPEDRAARARAERSLPSPARASCDAGSGSSPARDRGRLLAGGFCPLPAAGARRSY